MFGLVVYYSLCPYSQTQIRDVGIAVITELKAGRELDAIMAKVMGRNLWIGYLVHVPSGWNIFQNLFLAVARTEWEDIVLVN